MPNPFVKVREGNLETVVSENMHKSEKQRRLRVQIISGGRKMYPETKEIIHIT